VGGGRLGEAMQRRTLPEAGGDVEGHLQGLLRVEAGVAVGVVAAAQVVLSHLGVGGGGGSDGALVCTRWLAPCDCSRQG
jgi:hypothetical protein